MDGHVPTKDGRFNVIASECSERWGWRRNGMGDGGINRVNMIRPAFSERHTSGILNWHECQHELKEDLRVIRKRERESLSILVYTVCIYAGMYDEVGPSH
jgi:hypothetical protein